MNDTSFLIKPYLQIATICERHILEADGALTIFRAIDRFTVSGQASDMPPTVIPFTLIVSFRSGNFRGRLDLSLTILSPSLSELQNITFPVLFEGDDERNCMTIAQVQMQVPAEGLYWITVNLEGQEYTRIPMRVVYQRQPIVSTGG